MDRPTPAAFLSYVRFDDEHEEGRLTQLRERLSGEVRMQTGEPFPIFQDRNDIGWGQNWRERIERSLDEVTFLIPVVTPSFLTSDACQEELRIFLEREKALERNDLILPLYYVDSPILNDKRSSGQDPLAQAITEHQYADWRDLRFEPLTSAQVGVALARLAVQIRDALARAKDSKATSRPETPKVGAAGGEGTGPETSSPPESKEPPGQTGLVATTEAQQGPRRPSPKTEPPVRVVDPFHRGDHASIGEALTAANPGDRILVRPGLYKEGLVIEKPLEIIGDGDVNDIVIQATGQHAVSFRTMMGRVANLSLQQAGGGDWYGVDIAQGRLELEECDITSQSWACVAIHGGADPRVRDNRIHDSLRGGGVLVYENSQGVIEGNDIFGNAVVAVEIKDGSNPTLRRNRIHEGQSGGVMVHTDAVGTFEDNDIFGNALAGVAITEGGNPTLRRNRIHDGQGAGVLVNKKGLGTLEDNEIFSNALAGVAITEGGNPTLRRNRIHGGQQAGVLVLKEGLGTLEDNEIFANALAGVAIREGGNPTLRRNRIHDGQQGGVLVYDHGLGTLEDNEIFGNALAGVEIRAESNLTLRRNRIHGNVGVGVNVYSLGGGTFEDNDLRGNKGGAWSISSDSKDTVKRSRNKVS